MITLFGKRALFALLWFALWLCTALVCLFVPLGRPCSLIVAIPDTFYTLFITHTGVFGIILSGKDATFNLSISWV